jgi:Protein of unknown function (DUF3990)
MPPIYAAAPPWVPPRSQYIRLYHGCTSHDANNIQTHGIDLTLCRTDTDFGRGFYTTTVLYQARQWAWNRFYDPAVTRIRPNQPVVLKFLVNRYHLADLYFISFVLGGRTNRDFWSLVQHCRHRVPGTIKDHRGPVYQPDGTRWYDVACGPVAALWRQRYAMQDADQVSFHTAGGVRVLQRLIDSKNKKFFKIMVVP